MKKIGLVFVGAALSVMAAFGVGAFNHTDRVEKVGAYGESDTTWYVSGEFNNWNKADEKCHLTYSGKSGNNWQFDSDYALKIKKGEKFNIVYSWNSGSDANTFCPDLEGDAASLFTNPTDTDYFTANRDVVVKLYFQVYGDTASWTGLYAYELTDSSEYDDDHNKMLESWAYDFVKLTGTICDGTDRDNESALSAIWEDSSITSTATDLYYVAADFNGWSATGTRLYQTTTNGVYKVCDVFIHASQGFKVTNGTWDISYPASNVYPGSNGYYTITFDTRNGSNSVTCTKQSNEYLKASFNELSATAKSFFNSTNETVKIAAAYERYVHIINHYASLTNFASGTVSRNNAGNYLVDPTSADSTGTTMIAVFASFAAVVAAAGFVFLKKKKSF